MSARDHIQSRQFPGGEAFKYESQMKSKPNSQGTLFQVNPSQLTPESRQPRGYSPERFAAVTEALGEKNFPLRKDRRGTTYGKHEHGGMSYSMYAGHAGTAAKAISAVARSTVPLSDITPRPNEPVSEVNPTLHLGIVPNSSDRKHVLADYHTVKPRGDSAAIWMTSGGHHPEHIAEGEHPKWDNGRGDKLTGHQAKNIKGINRNKNTRAYWEKDESGKRVAKMAPRLRDTEADTTVIHEIGHHVDRDTMKNNESGWSDMTATQRVSEKGRREGFADKYADTHARLPGRKNKRKPSASTEDPTRWTGGRMPGYSTGNFYEDQSFAGAYHKERHGEAIPHKVGNRVISKDQFNIESVKHDLGPNTFPKGHIPGQLPLLNKNKGMTRYTSEGDFHPDYGKIKWGYAV